MTAQVLIVEDEDEIRELIALHLRREGLITEDVATGEQAIAQIFARKFDLLILDWMLPKMSGLEITRLIRQKNELNTMPILMVTARADNSDIVLGLEAGADDYLTKPFDPNVLMARVRALLRRHAILEAPKGDSESIEIGNLVIYPERYEVHHENQPILLTPSEFKLLLALAHNRGKVLTRESLIDSIQGEGVSVVGRTVDTHVFGLRKKLGSEGDVIETVRGIGYRVR